MPTVSIREVALQAGVSVGTVSNALNSPEKVAEATLQRVQQAIESLGYVRNDAARQLRAGTSRSIGFIVLDVANPFFTDVARGAQAASAEVGLNVLLGTSDHDPAKELAYLDLFEQQRVQGVLFTPIDTDAEGLDRLHRRGVPIVLVDHPTEDPRFCSVAVDDVAGGEMAVRHLLEQGRRRIVMLAGPPGIRQVAQRTEGARRAVAAVPDARLEVLPTPSLTVLEGRAAGAALADRAPQDQPDAVFAANDLLAVGCLQGLSLMGRPRRREPVALIGYDDIDFASATVVPLSSIRQPKELLGRTAVELLLAQVAGGPGARAVHHVFQPELVVRESSTRGV
ncbi:LacI family DNA-binding transcriptional regulator [Auraticoccus cholistanensis]|uniref:LacI family DNA-binding transcriptional regulator n=1 Tax=Auraticoccus cholistanensis TaxID=2656650 RepID=UPI002F9152F0